MSQFSFREIFKPQNVVAPQPSTSSPIANIQDGESYVAYGKRLCGYSNGKVECLPIYFQRVIQAEHNRFASDEGRQSKQREAVRAQIISKQAELQKANNDLDAIKKEILMTEDKITEKNGEIDVLNAEGKGTNKSARLKFYFGLAIIALLTIYLFIFYSSTFYTAFFGADSIEDVSDAMFNSSAITNAWSGGFGPLIFVCTAPVIFMALGYALHYFSLQEGIVKYFKVIGCVLVTFIFDCLLAYSIADKCYQAQVMNSLEQMPPYNMSMAITDANVWIVIFCGFITYMIWGIVLDMVLSAYDEFKCNSGEIKKIKCDILKLNNLKSTLLAKETTTKKDIVSIESQIKTLENSMTTLAIPISKIKEAVTDFFAGWTTLINVLQPSDYDSTLAKQYYDNCINSIA